MDAAERSPAEHDPPPAPLTHAVPLLWAFVTLALASLLAAGILAFLHTERGPRPPFLSAPSSIAPPPPPRPAPDGTLELAGSGSNLPLTRILVEAFRQKNPATRLVVHESIGSTGGVRAARDGVIGVGLISRPLSATEAKLGMVVTPYARVAVVVAAHADVPEACVTRAELVALYGGRRARWSDGSRVVVLQRERGDSSFLAFERLIPGLAAENDAAYAEARFRVLYEDRAMQEALLTTAGAVGIFDLGAIDAQKLPIKVLCVDGVLPSREGLLAGRYPFAKDLAFVTAGPPTGLAAELLRFVRSPEGRLLTASSGYLPLPLEAAEATP